MASNKLSFKVEGSTLAEVKEQVNRTASSWFGDHPWTYSTDTIPLVLTGSGGTCLYEVEVTAWMID